MSHETQKSPNHIHRKASEFPEEMESHTCRVCKSEFPDAWTSLVWHPPKAWLSLRWIQTRNTTQVRTAQTIIISRAVLDYMLYKQCATTYTLLYRFQVAWIRVGNNPYNATHHLRSWSSTTNVLQICFKHGRVGGRVAKGMSRDYVSRLPQLR